jgi:hypothetical protein
MKPKFKVGQHVKIIGGAPISSHYSTMNEVGNEGAIVDINDRGWIDEKLGKHGYKVHVEGSGLSALYYPENALEAIG